MARGANILNRGNCLLLVQSAGKFFTRALIAWCLACLELVNKQKFLSKSFGVADQFAHFFSTPS